MKTEVVMKRELFGREISQKSKNEYLSATDLMRAGNIWRMQNDQPMMELRGWLRGKRVQEFIAEIEKKFEVSAVIKPRGRGKHTWFHPLLFVDLALSISPQLKVEVYQWLMDSLLKYRNDSGDSYRVLAGALFVNSKNKTFFNKEITGVANRIRDVCGVQDWQRATEVQLALRNDIHRNIRVLSSVIKDNEHAVRAGIAQAIKDRKE